MHRMSECLDNEGLLGDLCQYGTSDGLPYRRN